MRKKKRGSKFLGRNQKKPTLEGHVNKKVSKQNDFFVKDIDKERHPEEQVYKDENWGKETKKKTA